MAHPRKGKARPDPAAPLTAEAEARLAGQIDEVKTALEAGADLPALAEQVTPDPQDPQWDACLITALGTLKHPAIPALLARLFGEAKDKVRRKALKKALHLLKTKGVVVPEDLLPREEAGLKGLPSEAAAAFVTPIFGLGESYVILEGPAEILRGNFLVSRINDRKGFRECVLLNIKRKQQTEFWEQFRKQGLGELISPPPAYAVAMLEQAYAINPDAPGASQYGALRERIFQHWGRPEDAPDLEATLPEILPGEQTRLLEESRNLAMDPLFHSWLPGPEEIASWLTKIKDVQDSPLVLSDQQKQVRLDAVMDEATSALYPPETGGDWGQRLKITAYYLHLLGREEDSKAARAAAADLAKMDKSPLAGENLFLKGLVQLAVRLAWEARQPQEAAGPTGLVVPPGEGILTRR